MTPEQDPGEPRLWPFAVRALTAVAIAAAAFLLWQLRDALMIAFGAVVIAVLLLALADLLRRAVPLPHGWAVTAAALLVLLILAGFALLMGSQVRSQFAELWQRLPLGIEEIERRLGVELFGGGPVAGDAGAGAAEVAGAAPAEPGAGGAAAAETGAETGAGITRLWGWVSSFGYPVVSAVFGTVLVSVGGVFLAMQPGAYRRGAVKLFPPAQHARIDDTFVFMGRSLRFWLIGELIAMAIIGLLAGVGTWALGLPAPVALGLFAALTEFVPIIGPFVGAAPAVLLALTQDGSTVLWTILLYLGIQQVESNLIAPIVQERMVRLPPALFLLAVVVFGGIFGILGVIFAAPLAVVTYVVVQKLWVRDTLHEETRVTGEDEGR